ncbi:MAG TPA: hypothetical protein VMF06_09765 [Candidatus Limnocylindria bacterium]|nr:hypothetical protein [Candidatus Limnocylindria bacterium]
MTRSEFLHSALHAIESRSVWERRQGMFFEMRHHGLRRRNKPWPGASDVHFPLADSVIERLKPAYFQQLYATDLVASFVPSSKDSTPAMAQSAAQWFDFQLRQRSNFEGEILRAIDGLLVSGRSVVKVTWNVQDSALDLTWVPLAHLIVPAHTRELEEADWLVHVQHWSPDAYRRENVFRQEADFVQSIVGTGQERESGSASVREAKLIREGITHSGNETIVLWETWRRDADGWYCELFSPLRPEENIRPPYRAPYLHRKPPFVDFVYELKEPGWYSPRGVIELVSVFEAELTKLLNEKNDAMTLYNRPLFRTTSQMPNTANLRWVPGQILPYAVEPVGMPQPPISFDQQIVLVRDLAEGRVSVPDFGMSQVRATKDPRTATEIQAISAATGQSSDLRLRIFRQGLGRLFRMSWSLLLQYASTELEVWLDGQMVSIPSEALRDLYRIVPSGNADGSSRQSLFQKAVARMQLFRGDDFIDQGELRKSVLEADDSGLVKRLYREPGIAAADQAERQAMEITVLRLGFPAPVKSHDDHAAHLRTVVAYVLHQMQLGQPPKGSELQMLRQHADQHLAALRKSDPPAAKEAASALREIDRVLASKANPDTKSEPPVAAADAPANPAYQNPEIAGQQPSQD